MVSMVRYAVDLPVDVIEAQIGNAFDLIVQTARSREGLRFVSELVEVSFDAQTRRCQFRTLYVRKLGEEAGVWLELPSWIDDLVTMGWAEEEEVRTWMRRWLSV